MQSIVSSTVPRTQNGTAVARALGWVGAGRMGAAMIERLLEAGHPGYGLQPDPFQARAAGRRRSRRRPSRSPTSPASEVVFTAVGFV